MFQNIGIPGIVLILVLALIIFGPSKLPEIGRAFGTTLKEFKKATNELVNGETTTNSNMEDKTLEQSDEGKQEIK